MTSSINPAHKPNIVPLRKPSAKAMASVVKKPGGTVGCIIVVLDSSGSMAETSGGQTKIQIAWDGLIGQMLPRLAGSKIGLVLCSSPPRWVLDPSTQSPQALTAMAPPAPVGTTPMLGALHLAWRAAGNYSRRRILLLTDGKPDEPHEEIIQAAMRNQVVIDAIGVGVKSDDLSYDPAFLGRLAAATGGVFMDINDPSSLPASLAQLSPANRPLLASGRA